MDWDGFTISYTLNTCVNDDEHSLALVESSIFVESPQKDPL